MFFTQENYRSQFFAWFYFSINAGALLSKFVTPMFRADIDCYPGETGHLFEDCYAMAFGIPGLLMLIALSKFGVSSEYCLCVGGKSVNVGLFRFGDKFATKQDFTPR